MPLEQLATGVYAWLEQPSGLGRPNAGAVIDHDGATVIDTLMVPSQAERFGAAVDALGVLVRRVLLTSSHIEFAGGTGRFRLAAFYGRRQASVHLDQPPNVAAYQALMPEFAREFEGLETRPVTHLVLEPVHVTPAIAAIPTRGQVAENLVAVVPMAGVVFGGAMCSFGVTPLAFQGNPEVWAAELEAIADLAPVIVPGHGPVGGPEDARLQAGYLRACVDAEGDPAAIPPGPWDRWAGREFDVVNVERAALLARGEDEIPSSLLRAIGLA